MSAYDDLDQMLTYIVDASGFVRSAQAYIDRILARCAVLGDTPEIGRPRPDLGEGLRQVPMESAVILYIVRPSDLYVVRIFHGGQDYEAIMRDRP